MYGVPVRRMLDKKRDILLSIQHDACDRSIERLLKRELLFGDKASKERKYVRHFEGGVSMHTVQYVGEITQKKVSGENFKGESLRVKVSGRMFKGESML